MSFTYQSIKRVALPILGMAITVFWLEAPGLTADYTLGVKQHSTHKVAIRNISPVRDRGNPDSNLRPEQVFDVVGSLNSVDGNRIVIGDKELFTASDVSAQGIAISSQVGAKLNKNGQIVSIEKITDDLH